MAGLLIVAIGALAVYGSFFFGVVSFGIDTTTYLQWHPWVPLGYPMFLSAIKETVGLRWTALIQIALLVGSCAFASASVLRLTGIRFAGIATMLLLLGHTEVFRLQGVLFSEGLFVPLLVTNAGAGLFYLATKARRFAVLVALTAAAAMFVRPAGYFLAAAVIFLILCLRDRRTLLWAGASLLVFIACTAAVNYGVRGGATQSQVGRVLLPHAAFLFAPSFAPDHLRKYAFAVEATMTARRAEYAAISTRRILRVTYSMNDYNRRVDEFAGAIDTVCLADTQKNCSNETIDAIMRDLFLATIWQRPSGYLLLVADGLLEAWRTTIFAPWLGFNHVYSQESAAHDSRLRTAKDHNLPLGPDDIRLSQDLPKRWVADVLNSLDAVRIFITAQRWLIIVIGVITFVAIPVSLFARSTIWRSIGYCGVLIHGAMLLTAATTVFIPRYALPVDMIVLIALAITASAMGSALSASEARSKLPSH